METAKDWLACTMQSQDPHFVLYAEASVDGASQPMWKFVLQAVGDDDHFTAADSEPFTRASRLELLAVVRGLEALEQPSRVTLLTRSRYVRRGIRRELNQWREQRWQRLLRDTEHLEVDVGGRASPQPVTYPSPDDERAPSRASHRVGDVAGGLNRCVNVRHTGREIL